MMTDHTDWDLLNSVAKSVEESKKQLETVINRTEEEVPLTVAFSAASYFAGCACVGTCACCDII